MSEPGDRPHYPSSQQAHALLAASGDEFAILPGPPHAFPPYEIVPLAPKMSRLPGWPEAILQRLGIACAKRPLRLAVVTAAAVFEADQCLAIALKSVRAEVASWPVSGKCRKRVVAGLRNLDETFEKLVTASDTTEHRLKPHRDLYTTALQRLGIEPEAYDRVLGIEDSCAGITALRAAGIGLAVAVPFEHSGAQDYSAAAHVVHGGLPALLVTHGLFLPLMA